MHDTSSKVKLKSKLPGRIRSNLSCSILKSTQMILYVFEDATKKKIFNLSVLPNVPWTVVGNHWSGTDVDTVKKPVVCVCCGVVQEKCWRTSSKFADNIWSKCSSNRVWSPKKSRTSIIPLHSKSNAQGSIFLQLHFMWGLKCNCYWLPHKTHEKSMAPKMSVINSWERMRAKTFHDAKGTRVLRLSY